MKSKSWLFYTFLFVVCAEILKITSLGLIGVITKHWELFLAVSGLMAAFWTKVKSIYHVVSGIFLTRKYVDNSLTTLLIGYLESLNTRKKTSTHIYGSSFYFVKSLNAVNRVPFSITGSSYQTYKLGGLKRIKYYPSEKEDDGNAPATPGGYAIKTFTRWEYLRGSIDWEDLIKKAINWELAIKQARSKETNGRFAVYRLFGSASEDRGNDAGPPGLLPKVAGGVSGRASAPPSREDSDYTSSWDYNILKPIVYDREDIGASRETASLDLLSIKPELRKVIEDIRFWRDSEMWCKDRGIPWRMSLGFEGPPGTGKTSLARAVAEDLDFPIFILDLSSMTNSEFQSSWDAATRRGPSMVLFEDVDAVFEGRENKAGGLGALTFNHFINVIDGVERPHGMIMIFTTNHISKLDEAMRRPGRMDMVVSFSGLDRDGLIKLGNRIIDNKAMVLKLVDEHKDATPAQFQEICVRIALRDRFQDRFTSAN